MPLKLGREGESGDRFTLPVLHRKRILPWLKQVNSPSAKH
jgi:hypothetical protein